MKRLMQWQGIFACFILHAWAQSGWQLDHASLSTTPLPAHYESVPDASQVVLTASQQQEAKAWGLTHAQMQRVVVLRQQRSHWYYHKHAVTPVELLGLYARSDQERMALAQLAARQAKARVLQEIAFARAFTAASGRSSAR